MVFVCFIFGLEFSVVIYRRVGSDRDDFFFLKKQGKMILVPCFSYISNVFKKIVFKTSGSQDTMIN